MPSRSWPYRLPSALALLLLGAHFLRAGSHWLAAASVLLIGLVFVRRRGPTRLLQFILLAGTAEWIRSSALLVRRRLEMGQPYLRMAVILGAVAVFTALAAWLLRGTDRSGGSR